MLQHPVPNQIDERACFNKIYVEKDVDGVTAFGFGQMSFGKNGFLSATPGGIIKLLKYYAIPVLGKKATVVGRSAILGKPIAMLLLNENATVTICHSKTENKGLYSLMLVTIRVELEMSKRRPIQKTSAYTPVPGGVGPMTIATLLSQTVEAAEKKLKRC